MWSIKIAFLAAASLWLVGLIDQSLAQSIRLGPDGVEVRPAPEVLVPPPPRSSSRRAGLKQRMPRSDIS